MKNRNRTPTKIELEPTLKKLIENNLYSKKLILKIEEILELAKNGYEIKIKKRQNKNISNYNKYCYGMYFPDKKLTEIYKKNISDELNYNLTIIHETIHAKEDLIFDFNRFITEWHTELATHLTYIQNREVLNFIKELYKIEKF